MTGLTFSILFPPQFEPFQPYLAGPYLKGLLKSRGAIAKVVDLNIDFYDWMLTAARGRTRLGEIARAGVAGLKRPPRSISNYRHAIHSIDEHLAYVASDGEACGLTEFRIPSAHDPDGIARVIDDPSSTPSRFADHALKDRTGWLDADYVLISAVVVDQLAFSFALAREIRRANPAIRILLGGPYITPSVTRALEQHPIGSVFDRVLTGEAERVLLPYLKIEAPMSEHVSPDFEDLDLTRYWSSEPVLPYLVAHGCKWGKCTFCSHHLSYAGYRSSPLKRVVEDLGALKRTHNVRLISFCDEYLPAPVLKDLIDRHNVADLNLAWSTFVRPEPAFADRAFMRALYQAGARMLMFGFESFSSATLKAMKKGTNPRHYLPILEAAKDAGIAARLDILYGFPGETEAEAQSTFEAIRDNRSLLDTPFSSIAVAAFELREGTPIFEQTAVHTQLGAGLRGSLDYQVSLPEPTIGNQSDGEAWRNKTIALLKEVFSSDYITPSNKTHQLLFKDQFDRGLLDLPAAPSTDLICAGLTVRLLDNDVEIAPCEGGLSLRSLTNGGEVEVALPFSKLLLETLEAGFLRSEVLDTGGEAFSALLVFLARNDFVLLNARRAVEAA